MCRNKREVGIFYMSPRLGRHYFLQGLFMKKKLLLFIFGLIISGLCSIGLLACNTNDKTQDNNNSNIGDANQDINNGQDNSGSENGNADKDIAVKSLYLNKNELTLSVNDSETLTVTYLPTNATNKTFNWTSTNPTVARVENGTVTGINIGTTKIIVSTVNGVSDVCTVSVSPNEFTVTFDCNGGTLINGDLVQQVQKGESAVAPKLKRDGYGLSWDKKFDNVTENITITAVWTAIFNFDNETITGLTSYGLSFSDIEVPSSIDGYAVRTIADSAFANDTNLKSIVIPQSVTTLGQGVYNSTPNNIVATYEIGGQIFDGCSNLESLTLPFVGYRSNSEVLCVLGYLFGYNEYQNSKKITQQTNAAQYGDGNLISYIPNSLKSVTVTGGKIQSYAFQGCSSLTEVKIGDGVTLIGSSAFYGCSGLTSIYIPKNVTSISSSAFNNCSGLTSIKVSSENTSYHSTNNCLINTVNKTLVLGCKNSEIPYDGTVTSIGDYAFYCCNDLTSITIPNSVNSLGSCAFKDCKNLTNIILPNSVTTIDISAFENCNSLLSITIGKGLSSIGYYAFRNCSSLTNITVVESNSVYHSSSNCLIETESKTLILGCKNSVVPDDKSVTIIGMDAFYGCSNLTSIIIPNGITNIGAYAFYNCTELTNISLPVSLTTIAIEAFYGCTNLTSFTIPINVKSISTRAFKNCINLECVIFENPNGWTATYSDYVNRISDGILSDTAVAARYLTDYDVEYSWKRT